MIAKLMLCVFLIRATITDITERKIENRIIKKINDNDAIIPFYIACLKKNYTKYQTIFDQLDK